MHPVCALRCGLKLLVSGTHLCHEAEVEAWADEPEESDGLAVIDEGDGVPWGARHTLDMIVIRPRTLALWALATYQ